MKEIPQPDYVVPLGETFDSHLGIEIVSLEIGEVTAKLAVANHHKQPFGIVHGGVYASLAETVASVGTVRAVYEDGKIGVGMSNQTQFLRPVSNGHVHARGITIHRGRTTWVWDIEMTGDDGRLCAVSRMTIAIRDIPEPR